MAFEQVELRGGSITTKADIGKGRSAVTIGIDAPLTSEAAAALGCQEKLFTTGGEVRPDLFFSTSVFHLSAEAVAVHLELRWNREAGSRSTGCGGWTRND